MVHAAGSMVGKDTYLVIRPTAAVATHIQWVSMCHCWFCSWAGPGWVVSVAGKYHICEAALPGSGFAGWVGNASRVTTTCNQL